MALTAEARDPLGDARPDAFTPQHVEAIARRRGWLPPTTFTNHSELALESSDMQSGFVHWMAEAAKLLGARAAELPALEHLLECVFSYEPAAFLTRVENQAVLSREGARDVVRVLAARVLEGPAIDSDRFKEIVSALKAATGRRGPELFHPVRLALAGSAGEGEYDRVILLLDPAAKLPWAVPVKSCRQRILEFCAALV
jgi:anticodon-binding protein